MTFAAYLKGLQRLYASRDVALGLGRPATAAAVDRLERKYGFELPVELRNAFLATNGNARPRRNHLCRAVVRAILAAPLKAAQADPDEFLQIY